MGICGGFLQAGVNGYITILCHPLGSGAHAANPLHMFNVAHAKPWSRASIPQVSPTDVPSAAAAAAGSILTPG